MLEADMLVYRVFQGEKLEEEKGIFKKGGLSASRQDLLHALAEEIWWRTGDFLTDSRVWSRFMFAQKCDGEEAIQVLLFGKP